MPHQALTCESEGVREGMPNSHLTPSKSEMAQDHPDAPKQYGIRLRQETMGLVAEIQEHHRKSNKPYTLAAIVESAIESYYDTLVEDGEIEG
jgi:hypothetical protein